MPSLKAVNEFYNEKTGHSYDKVAIYRATRAQITKGWNFATDFVKTYYAVIGNSCTTLVTATMGVTFSSFRFIFEGAVPRVNFHTRQLIYSSYYSHSSKF